MSLLWFTMLYYVRLLAEEEKRTGREEQKTHPRAFFEPRKLASKSAFEAHHASILFANGGGGAPPPHPPPEPPAFLSRAGLCPPTPQTPRCFKL